MRGSSSGRPIMALLDVLGRRWALRVLWELRERPLGFRELQERCDSMSTSVLSQRLTELKEAGIITLGEEGYALTEEGKKLDQPLGELDRWAARWAYR